MTQSHTIRILIAEDDFLVAKLIRGMLIQHGYDIVGHAQNGRQAIEMTQSLKPDIVLMDIAMPDMNGLEASRRIQEVAPTPIIVLTAYETRDLAHEAADAGVAAYLLKPPNAQQLEQAIIVAQARFTDAMELRRLNRQLQLTNADLERFSRTVAHDLRHLLSPIMGYAEVLYIDYDTISREEARQDLMTIVRVAKDMNNLIDELLLLARVRQEEIPIVEVDMGAVMSDVLRRMDYTATEKQAQIITISDWPTVFGYSPWITEVWVNYLSNAIKYGGEEPIVEMGWSPLNGLNTDIHWVPVTEDEYMDPNARNGTATTTPSKAMGYFWIRDYGNGIPANKLENIFHAFTQLQQTKLRGHGLGLSIVKRIVERLGGQVGVRSEVGLGSTFCFTLPIKSMNSGQTMAP